MWISNGVSIAVINSFVSALNDPLRKYLTRFLNPFALVAYRGLVQAPLFCLWALIETRGTLPPLNRLFWTSVAMSGLINIGTSYLYNRSIQISTLSATIPFLSFTPAFLLVVGFLILGELPSLSGVVGIMIAVVGGFWLQVCSSTQKVHAQMFLNPTNANRGSLYMIIVAFMWSISSAFDKIGVQNSSPLIYGAAIQVIVAIGSFVMDRLAIFKPNKGDNLYHPLGVKVKTPWKMVLLAGITSVVSYYINLVTVQHLEVSYAIAIKRSGCIWSVLMGKILFKEKNLMKKIPSILLMVFGVVCIVVGK